MSGVSQRIEGLVASGRVSRQEADALSNAAERPKASPRRRWIDPFPAMDPRTGFAIAVGVAAVQLGLSRFGLRFDGALDMHLVSQAPSVGVALLDAVVSWPLLAAVLWLASTVVTRGVRLVDFLWGIGVARLPIVAMAIVNRLVISDPEQVAASAMEGKPSATVILVGLLVLPMLAWMFTWLFFAYRIASGARGARLWLSFVAGVVAAEVVSKLIVAAARGA